MDDDNPSQQHARLKKRPRGRPPHVPTELTIRQAREMVAYGLKREHVTKVLGIGRRTLDKYYGSELEGADLRALHEVSKTLYRVATDPTHPRCVTAAIWIEKTRGGYHESQEVLHSIDYEQIYREQAARWLKPAEQT